MLSRCLVPEYINMARHTGGKPNASCSKKQNRTNPSQKNRQGKVKNITNSGKKSKTVGRPRKSHCNENEMVQHTAENQNNASHTAENQTNANHTGRNQIDASSKKNRTETVTRQGKRRCNENENEPCTSTSTKKKLKFIRITETSDVSEEEEVDDFEGFLEGNATKNANFIKPRVEYLYNALEYIKKEASEGQYADDEIIDIPEVARIENNSIKEIDINIFLDMTENTVMERTS